MERGYGIIARVPLASGLLTGKFRRETVSGWMTSAELLTPRRLQEALERVDEMKGIVGGSARTLSERR